MQLKTTKPERFFLPPELVHMIEQLVEGIRADFRTSDLDRFMGFVDHLTGRKLLETADPRQRAGVPSELWFPGLSAKPWHDVSRIPWAQTLKEGYANIRSEVEALMDGRLNFEHPDTIQREDFDIRGWDNYHFQRLGTKTSFLEDFPENKSQCPKTMAVLEKLPVAGDAKFAIMRAGGYVKPHYSNFNGRLVCHLGLIVPPNCALLVEDEARTWKEGEVLLFDDTYLHEAWNRSDRDRAILLLDVWHPELTKTEIACLERLLGEVSKVDLTRFGL